MFIAILSTIMSSFAEVFWTKSLAYKVSPLAHSLASYPVSILLVMYFMYVGFEYTSIDFVAVFTIFTILIIDIVQEPVSQQIYKEEKISVIMPYLNLNKIFVIISSFFLYQDVSNISFAIILLTIVVITIGSIDTKNKKFPRNFGKILFVECSNTVCILLGGWLVLSYSEIVYFNVYAILGVTITTFICFRKGILGELKGLPVKYWRYRFVGALGWLSWFLSLVVIKNLGLSLSILLGFLGIGATLLISYIFMKDIPSKKSIILTITTAILIGVGYYFK